MGNCFCHGGYLVENSDLAEILSRSLMSAMEVTNTVKSYRIKKIEEIGKMTALSQEEIISNTKTVIQGLDTLKNEHNQILNSLLTSMKTIRKENGDTNLVEEKANILKKSVDSIELGLGEAQVMMALANHLQHTEAEKQKLRAQVRRLCQENAWLR